MATTSADPERLGAFVRGARGARDGLESRQRALTSLYASVHAACGYRRIDCASVGALATLLDGMGANERFVETVRTELLAADSSGNGPVTIDSAVIDNALVAAGVGQAPAAVEFHPAVMVGLPPTSGYVDDPICAANGNMVHQDTDVEFPAIAGALTLTRTWNSLRHRQPGAFGPGWSSVLDVRLAIDDEVIRAHLADGAIVPFARTGDGWEVRGRRGLTLTEGDGGFDLVLGPVRSFRFDDRGVLLGWRTGVAEVTVTRNQHGRAIGLHEDRTGRSLAVHWAGGYVESVTTDDGRSVAYERTASGTIAAARSHAGSLRYVWHRETLLRSVVDADGVAAFVNDYDDEARVLRQTSPHGRRTQYHYEPGGAAVIAGDDGVQQAMIHDARGNLTAVVDHDGSVMRLEYDDADRVVRVVERDGAEWRYDYDERDDLVRRVEGPARGAERGEVDHHDRVGHRPQRDYPSHYGDAMIGSELHTLVVGHQVVEVELEIDDRPRSMGLSIRVDGAKRWSSEEPGWRDVAFGVAGIEVFTWSARRLIVVPLKPATEAYGLDSDEDILLAFPAEKGWLLVCESSIRLVIDGTEGSRLDLRDVVTQARWDGERLGVQCDDGSVMAVEVAQGDLKSHPSST